MSTIMSFKHECGCEFHRGPIGYVLTHACRVHLLSSGPRPAPEGNTPSLVEPRTTIPPVAERSKKVTHRVTDDDNGTTRVVTFRPEQVQALWLLVSIEQASLLAERKGLVLARNGDQTRFSDLIKSIDAKYELFREIGQLLAGVL